MGEAARRTRWLVRNPATVSEKQIARIAAHPGVRKQLSVALTRPFFPKDIYISGPKGKYVHFKLSDPKKFDKRGFRMKSVGRRGTRLLIGCPKGQWDDVRMK